MKRVPLPIDSRLPEILDQLDFSRSLVLQAEPGAGKTTRVPAAIVDSIEGEVWVLEPRRVAAKMVACRVAEERDEAVGQSVGYQFRFESASSAKTRLWFLTEGMLMRKLLANPELRGVGAVVLDEFHERHIQGDLALALLKRLQQSVRPDLRILVMSATLQTSAVSKYLGGCPTLQVEGRSFEVAIDYLPSSGAGAEASLEGRVRAAVAKARRDPVIGKGNLLVFLPGMAEIRRTALALESHPSTQDLLCLPLHGELSREEQDRAVRRSERTQVILSTNIAESSLTIDGVTGVIDSGLHRSMSYSSWSGLPALVTRAISRASAIQRAGRAGRMAPGKCFRLYSKGEFEMRAPFDSPEILRAELSQTFLELASLGVPNPEEFDWFERPSNTALASARTLLFQLGALDSDGELVALGKEMARLPVSPRLARLVLEARTRGVMEEGIELAALISEGRLEGGDPFSALGSRRGDFVVEKVKERLTRAMSRGPSDEMTDRPTRVVARMSLEERRRALGFAVLCGFPDRVARKRDAMQSSVKSTETSQELIFAGGGTARWSDPAGAGADQYFAVIDAQERKGLGQARSYVQVRTLSPIDADWLLDLEPSQIREENECEFVGEKGRIEEVSRLLYGQLILSESRARPEDPEKLGELLARALLLKPEFLEKQERFMRMQKRLGFLAERAPELGLAPLDSTRILECLTEACSGKASLTDAREVDLGEWIGASLDPDQARVLERMVPDTVSLGRGRRAPIQYVAGMPPWIESRLQDFFGMKEGPSILDGRVPLTLHLLAPNYRAVQVTADLAGFWQRAYPSVRKELSRRYPRHSWPEDPLSPASSR